MSSCLAFCHHCAAEGTSGNLMRWCAFVTPAPPLRDGRRVYKAQQTSPQHSPLPGSTHSHRTRWKRRRGLAGETERPEMARHIGHIATPPDSPDGIALLSRRSGEGRACQLTGDGRSQVPPPCFAPLLTHTSGGPSAGRPLRRCASRTSRRWSTRTECRESSIWQRCGESCVASPSRGARADGQRARPVRRAAGLLLGGVGGGAVQRHPVHAGGASRLAR